MNNPCVASPIASRRPFWTIQPSACGLSQTACGEFCGAPGFEMGVDGMLQTNDWITSYAISVLYTEQRLEPSACGIRPGGQKGHWSESFADDGLQFGSRLADLPNGRSTSDNQNNLRAFAIAALQKLVTRGVAVSFDVDVSYIGGLRYRMDIEINGLDGRVGRVNVDAQRLSNGWVWSNDNIN